MADNKVLPFTGTGDENATFATDDIGGVNWQRVKVTLGADGVNDGDISSSNPVPVSDAGGSLTVDGTVAATQSGTWTAQIGNTPNTVPILTTIHDGTNKADVVDLTTRNALAVALVDTAGDQITTIGGGIQYTEGDTDASIAGTAMLMEGAGNALVPAQGTAADGLLVNLGSNNDVEVFDPGTIDIFGSLRTGQQNLKVDIQFYRDTPSQLVTVTTSNNGSAASSVGGALFSTSATSGGTSKGVSFSNVVYHGGSEIFAYFTAMWPTVGIANSYQRIGLYDSNNGAFIGYEGTSWGVTYRNNGSDTTVAKASFSNDALTGAAGSKFTRAGVPEAIDLTKLNVFRIRMGWVGGAPIVFEVLSPDGVWVVMHTLRFPNTSTGPSIRSADLPMTLDVAKTAGAGTDLSILTGCWAAGTMYQQADQTIIGQGSQTAINQNVLLDVAGTGPLDVMNYRSMSFSIVPSSGTVTAGAITFEASNDNTNWFAVPLFDATAPTTTPVSTYTIVASTNRAFFGPIHFRYFRARISTGLTGTNTGVRAVTHLKVTDVSLPSAIVQETGSALTALQLIDDPVIADDSAFTPATSKVMMAGFEADESSTDSVDEGDAGAARMTLDRKQIVTLQPHTAGGLSTFMASGSDGSTILQATAQAIKATAGQMYGYYAYNPEAAVTFVHFYNTAAASVTVGTTNPLFTIAIPAGSAANLTIPQGITFSNAGWSCAATTTAGGNTAPATGVSLVVWYA